MVHYPMEGESTLRVEEIRLKFLPKRPVFTAPVRIYNAMFDWAFCHYTAPPPPFSPFRGQKLRGSRTQKGACCRGRGLKRTGEQEDI
jgi:hypothetical protein